MALSASSVFEIRTAGNDTNGGGFVTGASGTDYSQQNGKNTVGSDISTTDAVAVGTGVITSITANFGTTIVGNIIYLQGGTGTLAAGWYQVLSRASTTSITVDRNVAAGTGITMNIGGALASPGMAGGTGFASGTVFYIKSGTYSITSASTNVTGGCFSSALTVVIIEGYGTVRGDLGTKPLLQASGISTFTIIIASGAQCVITNISVDGASLTSSRGINYGARVFMCSVVNCTNNAFIASGTSALAIECTATGCSTTAAFSTAGFHNCIAYDNTVVGFSLVGNAVGCIADSNSGATSDGFVLQIGGYIKNSVGYNNGRAGVLCAGSSVVENFVGESNGGAGVQRNNNNSVLTINCATFNNSGGGISLTTGKVNYNINPITYTASAFVDAPNQNFALNNTASAGASLRAAGYPGVLPIGGTGYIDIGALQHQDAGYVPQVME